MSEESVRCSLFSPQKDDQRSGVDICLSCGNYYLSYLLKYTLVNGIFKSQAQLSSMIPHELRGNRQERSCKGANPAEVMVCTKRIGIMSSAYKDADLAIARDINQRFVTDSGEKNPCRKNGTIKGIYRRRLFGRPNQHRGAKSGYQP